MVKRFVPYNKAELLDRIEKISIDLVGNQVVTKYGASVVSISNVSNRYEIFDIKGYLKSKIDLIESNFPISKYCFVISGGIQELTLISDAVEIGGLNFYKSFFILNSSDKSRKLSFNTGLYCDTNNFYVVSSAINVGLTKKHLRGVTKAAEEATESLNDEVFSDQISFIQNLVGHKILLSNLMKVIVGEGKNKVDHMKFDSFKNTILYNMSMRKIRISDQQRRILLTPSNRLFESTFADFYIDAFWAFQTYLRIFHNQDSHIIRRETDRMMAITQFSIRNQTLESLGI